MNKELSIVKMGSFETVSNVRDIMFSKVFGLTKTGETLSTEREPGNPKDKHTVSVK